MAKPQWIVVGGGFRGIMGAYLLAQKGYPVTLVERTSKLGGVLNSVPWQGFHLDKGCHLFSNESDETTEIYMDILGEDYEPVSVRYASVVNGIKRDGLAIPDFEVYGEEANQRILFELIHAAVQPEQETTHLQNVVDQRFGPTAGELIRNASHKMYQVELSEIEADAFWLTPFRRIKFLDNAPSVLLKDVPALDSRIAVNSQDDPMRFYRHQAKRYSFRNFYPKHRGLSQFGVRATDRLQALGVTLRLDEAIVDVSASSSKVNLTFADGSSLQGDHVLWTLGPEPLIDILGLGSLREYVHQTPMVFYYFIIDKAREGRYTYLQNFDRVDLTFRSSVPGGYVEASACPAGQSYICCEVPTVRDSAVWQSPDAYAERVWQEAVAYGVVNGGEPRDQLVVPVPATYKLPKLGYSEQCQALLSQLDLGGRLIGVDHSEFSKNDIIATLKSMI